MARSTIFHDADASRARESGDDVVVVLGSRREAISLAPLIRVMTSSPRWNVSVVTTGEGLSPLARTLESLDVVATEDLGIDRPGLSSDALIGRAIERTHAVVSRRRPSAMIVEGDSTTVVGASLAAFHEGVMVAHVCSTVIVPRSRVTGVAAVAAMNARLIAQLAQLHFVPSAAVSTSLLHQGIDPHSVVIVGAPAIDNLRWILRNKPGRSQFATVNRRILVVLRHSETVTAPLDIITQVTARLAGGVDVEIVVPLQHRLVVRSVIEGRLGSLPRVRLTGDLDYRDYVATMESADIVITDSPSVQAEALTLHKPCVRASEDLLDDYREAAALEEDLEGRVEAIFAESRRLLDDEDHCVAAASAHDLGLGGLAANSMELRLRSELATRGQGGRVRGDSQRAVSVASDNGRAQ